MIQKALLLPQLHTLRRHLLAVLALLAVLTPLPCKALEFETTPIRKDQGKWRIGYYEGGPYFNYQRNLTAFIEGLMELGWVERQPLPELKDPADTSLLWDFAATRLKSDYLTFVREARWSAGWSPELRENTRQDCIRRLQAREVDFMLVAGTWAGEDLATDEHHVPLTVCAVSNPVQSGIVHSPYKSSHAHVHAKCDPDRYVHMARIFYNIFEFKTLGITYEDTPEGRIHGAVEDFEKAARVYGFTIRQCVAPFQGVSQEVSTAKVIECQKSLAQTVDAAIIPVHRGVTTERMADILAPYLEKSIPTLSQQGRLEVQHGVLLGITLPEGAFREIGLFHARVAASAFHGLPVGELPLIFPDPRGLVINMETAREIGFDPMGKLDLHGVELFEPDKP